MLPVVSHLVGYVLPREESVNQTGLAPRLVPPPADFGGQFFGLFLMLYATGRFLNEFNRGDYPQLIHGFTNAQVLCFFLFPLGLIIFLGRSRFGKAAYCTKNGAFGSSSPQAEKAAPSGDAQNG